MRASKLVTGTTALAFVALLALAAPARASLITFATTLGPEVPGATGSGSVTLVFDDVTHDLTISADWSGLGGITTVAHIHCCTASPGTGTIGVAVTPGTLPGFPAGVSSGTYNTIVDLDLSASFTAGFVANFGGGTIDGAIAALLAGFDAGTAYFNIHTNQFPGGEIRGFIARVPEPGTVALLAVALLSGALAARRRRK